MSNVKTIEIFRAGSHVDNSGRALSFSRGDVEAIAAAYDAAAFAAPLVVGHPKTNDPAFGWVKSLAVRKDGVLVAEPEKVEPQFAEAVRAGRYRKVSASFYLPDHPGNPAPGQYYLRHVGFLGAAAPAVKGLSPVELNEREEKIVTVEFSDSASAGPKGALAGFLASLSETISDFMDQEKLQEGKGTGPAVRARIKRLQAAGMSLEDISKALSAMGANASRSAGTLSAILNEEIANPPDSLIGFLNRVKPPKKTSDNAEGDPEEDGFAESELTRMLNSALDASVDEDTTRRQLIERAASRAGVASGTVRAILRGDIEAQKSDPIIFNIARTFGLTLSPAPAGFSDNTEKEDTLSADEKARLAALEAENADLKKKAAAFAEAQGAARKKEDADFVAGLVKDGKLAPAMAAGVTSFMQSLDADKTVSFSEGDAKTPRAFFRALLENAGKVIDFAERSAGSAEGAGKPQALEERMAANFKTTGKE
jgi:DNA-binding transcriptional MerR regulator